MRASRRDAIPTIACVNQAAAPLGIDFDKLVTALQKFLDGHFVPVWGKPAKLVKARTPQKGAWTMIFLDDADQARASDTINCITTACRWRRYLSRRHFRPAAKSAQAPLVSLQR